MLLFKGKKFNKHGTWTKKYAKWRYKNHLCNSPMAWALMKREEKRKEDLIRALNFTL